MRLTSRASTSSSARCCPAAVTAPRDRRISTQNDPVLTTLKKHAQSIEVWGIIMMKPTYTIAIAAIFMVAAFAGIALSGDDADAEAGADGKYTVAFAVGDVTYNKSYDNESIVLPALKDVVASADDAYFQGWSNGEGQVLAAGSQYTIDNASGVPTLTAKFTTYSISFTDLKLDDEAESETYGELIEGDAVDIEGFDAINAGTTVKLPEATDAMKIEGYQFVGWKIGDVTYAAGDEIKITSNLKAVAVYNDGFIVTLVAGEYSVEEKSIGLNSVFVPTLEGNTFIGWYDPAGKMAFDAKGKLVEGYVFTADVILTAKFEANTNVVTFMVGDEIYSKITVPYNDVCAEPKLPAGYAAWGSKVVEQVTGEDGTVTEVVKYVEFDFTKAITAATTLYAIAAEEVPDDNLYVTFNIEGVTYGPYVVSERFSIPQTDREGYNFLGWTVEGGDGTKLTSSQVQNYEYTEDVTFVAVYEVAEPPAPEEPAFYETSMGQIAIVIVIFAILAFGYGVYSNAFGLKDKLFGYTIQKKEKKE